MDLDLRLLVGDSCSGYFKHIESSFAEFTFLSEESKYVLFLKGVGRFLCLSSHRGETAVPTGGPQGSCMAALLRPSSPFFSLHCSWGSSNQCLGKAPHRVGEWLRDGHQFWLGPSQTLLGGGCKSVLHFRKTTDNLSQKLNIFLSIHSDIFFSRDLT